MLHCEIKFAKHRVTQENLGKLRCPPILQHGKMLKMQYLRLSCWLPGRYEQGTCLSYGQGYPHNRQQELRLLVAARLAAVQDGGSRLRGADRRQRRSFDPR